MWNLNSPLSFAEAKAHKLSLASACALLLVLAGCGGRDGKSLPASVSRFPDHLSNPSLQLSGVYQDGWAGPAAALNLALPGGRQELAIKGMVPRIDSDDFRTEVDVSLDGRLVARESLGIGDFALEMPAAAPAGHHRISMAFSKPQTLPGADGRSIGAKLAFVGFEPKTVKRRTGSDIVRQGHGIRLGTGWDVLETFNKETFRWVSNDAQVLVMGLQPGTRRLSITAQPGPGLGGKPLVLKVTDASGRQVDVAEFPKRATAELFVPVEAGKETEFRLHVDGGGAAAAKDPRTLNFRVFEIEAQ